MRTISLLAASCALPLLVGCAPTTTFVHTDTALGRVVLYRNGVAYFERTAHIEGDTLSLAVPADKVDDFLKSLTVSDARTGEPAPIAYPTHVPASETGLTDMAINLSGAAPHDIRVSYVTEAPAWKPSYRVVLDKDKKVNLQAWAIVDNTSGEDWKNVQLGVGSSSALSFRFDLRSVRLVQRDTLRSDDLFAQAPPLGGASYDNNNNNNQQRAVRVMGEMSDDVLNADGRFAENDRKGDKEKDTGKRSKASSPPQPVTISGLSSHGGGGHASAQGYGATPTASVRAPASLPPPPPPPSQEAMKQAQQTAQVDAMARSLQSSKNQIVIEGYADHNDGDKHAASLERANRAREQLLRRGVDPGRVVAIGNGEQAGHAAGVRIVEAPPADAAQKPADPGGAPITAEPIGTSHFESGSRMTVARGTSAMVSILKTDTEGEVVYYYDPESARGNTNFPFRAVRIKNPTDSVLESGPVTVFGDGRFIGEGMAEPIPARSAAFVPFALDRQIVVEQKNDERDKIARILTVQRGVFSTQVQHIRKTTLVLTNRTAEAVQVYVRHTVPVGYTLTDGPKERERIGGAHLFRIAIGPSAKTEITIEEATPIYKSTDIRAPGGMEMVTAFLSSAAEGQLKVSVDKLLALHKEMADTEQRIATLREQMGEYRERMDELHAQIVSLKLVKTAGPLMTSLEKKLQEVSDRLSKSTIDLVALEEKRMVAKVRFQDGVADLSLEKKPEDVKPDAAKGDGHS